MSDVLLGGTVSAGGSPFPIVRDTEILGGMRAVADTTARDAIIAADLKAGMLVCCQSDTVPYTVYQLTSTSPLVWTAVSIPGLIAGWGSSSVAFLTWDPVGGNDATAAITVGSPDWSKAIATPAGLYTVLPKFGAGCTVVLLVKPKASLASFALSAALDLSRHRGYKLFVIRASAAGTNDAADKVICGGQVATGTNASGYNPTTLYPLTVTGATNASPIEVTTSVNHGLRDRSVLTIANVLGNTAANGTWVITVTAANKFTLTTPGSGAESTGNGAYTSGGTITSRSSFGLQLAGGGAANLTADPGLAFCRIRFDAATTTAALRNVCRSIYLNSSGAVVLSNDLPADWVLSDVCYIEQPAVVLGNSITLGPIADTISLAGIDYTSMSMSSLGSSTINQAFCRSSVNSGIGPVDSFQFDQVYTDETGASITPGGCRLAGGMSATRVGSFVGRNSYLANNFRMTDVTSFLLGAGMRSNVLLEVRGCGPGVLELGSATLRTARRIGNGGSLTSRRFLLDAVDNRVLLEGTNANIYGLDFGVPSGSVGGITPLGRNILTVDDVVGEKGTNGAIVDLTGSTASEVAVGVIKASTAGGASGHIGWNVGGALAYTNWLDSTVSDLRDGKANHVYTADHIGVGPAYDFPASATQIFRVVRSNSGVAVHAKADTSANASQVIGVAMNSQSANGATGSLCNVGIIPIVFDALPTVGNMAYLSTANAGQAMDSAPAVSGTNQEMKLGHIVARTTYAGLSIGYVAWNPDKSPVAAGTVYATAPVAIAQGGTGQVTAPLGFAALSPQTTKGDLLVYDTAPNRLAVGSNNQVLIADSAQATGVKWGTLGIAGGGTGQVTAAAAFDALSPNAAKGDLTVRSSTSNSALNVGSNNQVLIADSAQTLGVKWGTTPIAGGGTGQVTATAAFDALSPLSTKGDIIVYNSTTGHGVRLGIGSDTQVLTADSSIADIGIKWATPTATTYTFSTGLTNTSSTITVNLTTGLSGGQSVVGDTASGGNLTLSSTAHATKGKTLFGSTSYFFDEANSTLVLGQTGTQASSIAVLVASKTVASATSAVWKGVHVAASTLTLSGNTAVTTATGVNLIEIAQPTITSGSALTVSLAATVYIADAPAAGGSTTITSKYALFVDNGNARFDGVVIGALGSAAAPTFTFAGLNDGLFSLGTGSCSLAGSGTEVLRCGSSTVQIINNAVFQTAASTNTASAPAVCRNSDTNCGIFWPANDNIGLTTNGVERLRCDSTGNVTIGTAALSTGATDGFLYISSCAGIPTGTPTAKTGLIPVIYDSSDNRIYAFNGQWRMVAVA